MNVIDTYKSIEKAFDQQMLSVGFTKKSGSYKKDFWFGSCLFGLQKSKKSNKEKIEFTINIGLIPNEQSVKNVYKTDGIKEAFFCPLRTRIGYVNGINDDRWYPVESTTKENSVLDAMIPELRRAFDWLNGIKEPNDLVEQIFQPLIFTLNDTGRWFLSLALLRKHDQDAFQRKSTELRNTDMNLFIEVDKFLGR